MNLHWHRKAAGFESIKDYHGDLILLNTFPGADEIAEIVRKENIFDQVILLQKTFNQGALHKLYTLLDMVSPSFYMYDKHKIRRKEILDRYDVITAPKYSLMIDQIWRLNKHACLDLIEDGTASYDLVIDFGPDSPKIDRMRKYVGCNDFRNYRCLYLINKDLYTGPNEERVREVPKYDKDFFEEVRGMFASFYQDFDKDIYWLSQFFNNKDFNITIGEILKTLLPYKDDLLFVQHPRNHLDNKFGFDETNGKQIWEIQLLEMDDIENKLFIAAHSTALYSAKTLYDLEPYLILFYRLGERWVTAATPEFDAFLEKFRNSYRDPEKVMIPETLEEFKECVRTYLEKRN
jgi:hypothetical protein